MSKVIGIFAFFLIVIAIFAGFFFYAMPQSLETLKSEIISSADKNGFAMEIGNAQFTYPDKIIFEEIFAMNGARMFAASEKCELIISPFNYLKAIFRNKFKNKKIELSDFVKEIITDDLVLVNNSGKIENPEEIFKSGKNIIYANARIFFDGETLNKWIYSIKTENINIFGNSIENFEAAGVAGSENIAFNFNFLGGDFKLLANVRWEDMMLMAVNLSFENVDLQKILPADINAEGKLSGKIIPSSLPPSLAGISSFDDIIKGTKAQCRLSVKDFKLGGNKAFQSILDAVQFVGIENLNFREITADIDYSYENSRIKSLVADNFKYKVSTTGFYIPKTQKFNLDTEIHFNPDMKMVIQRNIWNAMTKSKTNKEARIITGTISGNSSNVSISLDSEIMKKGVNSILKEIEKLF